MDQPIPSLLCMLTTPGSASDERWRPSLQPQPYQERFLAALQSGERFETSSERWNRERSESRKAFSEFIKRSDDAAGALVTALTSIGQAARRAQASIDLTCLLAFHIPDQSPTLGRKRRRRRARGRQIQMNRQGGQHA